MESCECCGRAIKFGTAVWLELDQRVGRYHDFDLGVPEGVSQGWFVFGATCARREVAAAAAAAKDRGIYLGRAPGRRARDIRAAEFMIAIRNASR
jgi:hypothetical protein